MSVDERLKRPSLQRTAPIRRWPTLFGTAAEDAATREHAGAEREPAADADGRPRLGDTVQRAVELGYRVFDDQIRKGQEAAARIGRRDYGPAAMQTDVQDLAMRWVQYASDLTGVWLEMMQVAVASAVEQPRPRGTPPSDSPAFGSPPERHAPAPASTPVPRKLRIRTASSRPTSVLLDVRPEAQPPFEVLTLRTPTGDVLPTPRLDSGEDGSLLLDLVVPNECPPGTYFGVVVRSNGEGRAPVAGGTLAVTVEPA